MGFYCFCGCQRRPDAANQVRAKKALELGLKAIVVINKVDKDGAAPDATVDKTFDLFVKLNASHEQLDFQVIYASGVKRLGGYRS